MRSQWSRVFTSVLIASVMSSALAAQTLSVPDSIAEGDTVAVVYTDTSRAGETIIVTVTSGSLIPETEQLTITLDENGMGAVGWTVPDWEKATFTAPNVAPVLREVE